jgi:hypothetical protein
MTGVERVVRHLIELYLILLRRELGRRGVACDLQDCSGEMQLRIYRQGAIPAVKEPVGIVCLAYIDGGWWCCWPHAMVICPISPFNRAAEAIISELGTGDSMCIPRPAVRDYRDGQVTSQAAGTADERLRKAGHAARIMPLGDPNDWIRIAARAGARAEEIAEAGGVPAGHVCSVFDANAWRQPRMDQPRWRSARTGPLPGHRPQQPTASIRPTGAPGLGRGETGAAMDTLCATAIRPLHLHVRARGRRAMCYGPWPCDPAHLAASALGMG